MSERALPPARHEPQDVAARIMLILGGVAFAMLGLALLAVLVLFPKSLKDRSLGGSVPEFAEPRLQTSPRSDMTALRARQMRELETYGWVDRDRGVVHVPIEAAMARLAAQGIPDWPQPEGAGR
jgi:hypothetical protein